MPTDLSPPFQRQVNSANRRLRTNTGNNAESARKRREEEERTAVLELFCGIHPAMLAEEYFQAPKLCYHPGNLNVCWESCYHPGNLNVCWESCYHPGNLNVCWESCVTTLETWTFAEKAVTTLNTWSYAELLNQGAHCLAIPLHRVLTQTAWPTVTPLQILPYGAQSTRRTRSTLFHRPVYWGSEERHTVLRLCPVIKRLREVFSKMFW